MDHRHSITSKINESAAMHEQPRAGRSMVYYQLTTTVARKDRDSIG